MDVDATWHPMSDRRIMIAWNSGEAERIRQQVAAFIERVPGDADLKLLPVECDRHEWLRSMTPSIFDWLEGVPSWQSSTMRRENES